MTEPASHVRMPRADAYLIAITFIWGSTFAVSKYILAMVSPYELQFVRFACASVLVGIYSRRDIRATTRDSLRAGLVLGLLLGSGFLLQTVGLTMTTASRTAFLTGTMVMFTPLLQMAIERRLPTAGNLIGVALVVAGLALLTSPAGGSLSAGDVMVLASAVIFAFYIVYIDVFTRGGFRREIVFYQFVVTALIALAAMPVASEPSQWSPGTVFATLYLTIFASTIALFVQAKYQRETTPTRAAIIYALEPVLAAIIAWMTLGEHLGGWSLWGAAIMFAGLLTSELWPARGDLTQHR